MIFASEHFQRDAHHGMTQMRSITAAASRKNNSKKRKQQESSSGNDSINLGGNVVTVSVCGSSISGEGTRSECTTSTCEDDTTFNKSKRVKFDGFSATSEAASDAFFVSCDMHIIQSASFGSAMKDVLSLNDYPAGSAAAAMPLFERRPLKKRALCMDSGVPQAMVPSSPPCTAQTEASRPVVAAPFAHAETKSTPLITEVMMANPAFLKALSSAISRKQASLGSRNQSTAPCYGANAKRENKDINASDLSVQRQHQNIINCQTHQWAMMNGVPHDMMPSFPQVAPTSNNNIVPNDASSQTIQHQSVSIPSINLHQVLASLGHRNQTSTRSNPTSSGQADARTSSNNQMSMILEHFLSIISQNQQKDDLIQMFRSAAESLAKVEAPPQDHRDQELLNMLLKQSLRNGHMSSSVNSTALRAAALQNHSEQVDRLQYTTTPFQNAAFNTPSSVMMAPFASLTQNVATHSDYSQAPWLSSGINQIL